MTRANAQKWLALYFLAYTGFVGGYVLIFSETWLLPISKSEGHDSFQIIIPVFLGQLTIMFQWIAGNFGTQTDESIVVPKWAIQLPPLISLTIFLLASFMIVLGNANGGHSWAMAPDAFKNAVTFSVSILNASTVFLVTRLFPLPKDTAQNPGVVSPRGG